MAHCTATNLKLLLLAAISVVTLHGSSFAELTKSRNLTYILRWTYTHHKDDGVFEKWKTGNGMFTGCPVSDCYLTSQRDFFGGDIKKFDAIIFNGRIIRKWTPRRLSLPKTRSPHQKYIFFDVESSDNDPICSPVFDNYFNLTATYKLDSDIVFQFFIKDRSGRVVGPSINMTWTDAMTPIDPKLKKVLEKKSKAVAWFVSNCQTRSHREKYVIKLKRALEKYNLALDVYGNCGRRSCPKTEEQKCLAMLKDDYYFYLSFENSFAEDYVTEKLLTAINNNVVPIVYGGANYSRFVPPGSYLDATSHNPRKLAALIANIIASPNEYYSFFKWKNYTYGYPDNFCKLCSVASNETVKASHKVYKDFRRWWNPDFEQRCRQCRLCHQSLWLIVSLFITRIL